MADKSQTEMLTDYFNTLTDTQRTKALVFLFEYLQEQEIGWFIAKADSWSAFV